MSNNVKKAEFIHTEKRRTSEIKYHHDVAPGLRYLAIDNSLLKNSPIYIAIRKVTKIDNNQPDYVDYHKHKKDSLYLFIGDSNDLKGLYAEIKIGTKIKKIQSPMTVFIPSGISHTYKLTRGKGIFLSILLDGDYNNSTFSFS